MVLLFLEGVESGFDGLVKVLLRNEEKFAWKFLYFVLLFNLFCFVDVFVDDIGVVDEVKFWLVDRNELMKFEWLLEVRGLGVVEVDFLLVLDVLFSENWGVNDDIGLDDGNMWVVGCLKDVVVLLGEVGGGVVIVVYVIIDLDWLLLFVVGVVDWNIYLR